LVRQANPRVTAAVYAGLTDAGRAGLGAKLAAAFGDVGEGDTVVFHDHVEATSKGDFFGAPPSGGSIA
jgi:hypothetical protein